MNKDLPGLLPEMFLLAGAVISLFVGSFSPRAAQWRAQATAATAVVASLVATGIQMATGAPRLIYDYGFAIDTATNGARLIVDGGLLLVLATSVSTVRGQHRENEFYVLALLSSLGTLVMAAASDLLVLQIGLLLTSITMSGLLGWARDRTGSEATVKFFLLGVFASVVMVVGITILFGAAGTTSYRLLPASMGTAPHAAVVAGVIAILAGLLFKAGAVPLHFWLPDVAEGSSPPAAAFATSVPKVGALVALYRLFAGPLHGAPVHWQVLLGVVAVATMTVGNLAALTQDSPRRLLGYSTISQSGYLLLAVSVAGSSRLALPALLVYLAGYSAANLGAFSVVAALPAADRLTDYSGLVRRRPGLAAALAICLLALVGTSPTAVFFGKLSIFSAAGNGGAGWLVVAAAVNTAASLYYYLRWLAPAYLSASPTHTGTDCAHGGWSHWSAAAAAALVKVIGLASGAGFALFAGPLALT